VLDTAFDLSATNVININWTHRGEADALRLQDNMFICYDPNLSLERFSTILVAIQGYGKIVMNKAFLYSLKIFLGLLLLHCSGSAMAFTLIELPESNTSPSGSITDSTTFNTQIQPVIGAIQAHILDSRRKRRSDQSANRDNVLASNSYAESISDADFIRVSSHDQDGSGGLQSLWLNSTSTNFKNDFTGTEHNGDQHMLLAGFDYTLSDRYIFGVALSFETSNINTEFNLGNQEMDGFSLNPYFAYLISDTWSVDVSLGFGEFETDQYRTPTPLLLPITVDSKFDSSRDFIASNLTYSTTRSNWYLSGWLGLLVANKDQDSYTESDATDVDGLDLDMKRWSLGGEAAYGRDASETYVGLIYEKDTDFNELEFTTGEQPANDDDSLLFSIGWRYFGGDIVANLEFNSRLGADDISENSISSTFRIDL